MKSKISSLFISFLFLFALKMNAQEQLIPLSVNPDLLSRNSPENFLQRTAAPGDTLDFPFIDDFSEQGSYPYSALWLDSGVYVNTTFSEEPYTIGMATFDGLNSNGVPYQPGSTTDSIADVLTSHPIDLGVNGIDTSIWMSFFYQPQGLGEIPDEMDSLILQFKDTAGDYHTVWSVPGRNDTVFQRVNIHVLDPQYLYRGFQFRFYNLATVNGNRDHWNLDYVVLDNNSSADQQIRDVAMLRPQQSLLNEFTSMPYSHYKAFSPQQSLMKSEITDTIYDIDYGQTSAFTHIQVLNAGAEIFNNVVIDTISGPQIHYGYHIPLNGFVYPSLPSDSAEFTVKSYLNLLGSSSNISNDTSYLTQKFYNYYSYDDGSVEVAYGLTGNVDVEMAYKFDVKVADTLRGAQIYFNPTGRDASNKLFSLVVWNYVDASTNSSDELYRMIDQKPGNNDGINGFKTFLFDQDLIVGPGPVYIGIIQSDPEFLYGVGLDRNTDSRSNMFYHLDGFWHQSAIKGSWMIRPLFGKQIPVVSVEEVAKRNDLFYVSPVPASNKLTIHLKENLKGDFQFELTDCTGKIIMNNKITGDSDFNVAGLPNGIYLARIFNLTDRKFSSQKIIISH